MKMFRSNNAKTGGSEAISGLALVFGTMLASLLTGREFYEIFVPVLAAYIGLLSLVDLARSRTRLLGGTCLMVCVGAIASSLSQGDSAYSPAKGVGLVWNWPIGLLITAMVVRAVEILRRAYRSPG